jgi:hypothetical protein
MIVIKELKIRCSLALGKNKEAKNKVHDHIDKELVGNLCV